MCYMYEFKFACCYIGMVICVYYDVVVLWNKWRARNKEDIGTVVQKACHTEFYENLHNGVVRILEVASVAGTNISVQLLNTGFSLGFKEYEVILVHGGSMCQLWHQQCGKRYQYFC